MNYSYSQYQYDAEERQKKANRRNQGKKRA